MARIRSNVEQLYELLNASRNATNTVSESLENISMIQDQLSRQHAQQLDEMRLKIRELRERNEVLEEENQDIRRQWTPLADENFELQNMLDAERSQTEQLERENEELLHDTHKTSTMNWQHVGKI